MQSHTAKVRDNNIMEITCNDLILMFYRILDKFSS